MKTLYNDFPHYSIVQVLAIVNLIFYYSLLLFAIIGVFFLCIKQQWQLLSLPFGVITFGTLLLLLVGHGETRFHIPFMPFFIMLAAYFIFHIRKNAKKAMD